MYEAQSLLGAFIIVSTLTSLVALGLVRLARLGSPRARSFVLLVALAMAFTVFWAPFTVTTPSEDTDLPDRPVLDSASATRSIPFVFNGTVAAVSNGSAGPSSPANHTLPLPPARWIDGGHPPRTCGTQYTIPPDAVPKNFQVAAAQLQAAQSDDVNLSQTAGWFWALCAALLCAAATYLAVLLTFGKMRLMAKLGTRPCMDPVVLGLVSRTAGNMGVRPPRLFMYDGPANAFVFGYPATLVLSSRLLRRLTEAELELCIRHELAHIKNGDLLVKPMLQSLRILFVYNPGVHLLVRRMFKERELSADRLFIRSKKDRIDFMSALATLHQHEPKQAPAPGLPYGASALGAHRAGGHLGERFDNLFKEQEPRPLRAFSLCALVVFANLSLLGVPAAILQTSGASDAQGNTGMFPPVHGHFMSWRGAAESGLSPLNNVTASEAGHSPPGNATSGGTRAF
jgi:hypothetical protein